MTRQQCRFSGCTRPVKARELCGGHYDQQRTGKELRPIKNLYRSKTGDCSYPDCKRKHYSRGYCSSHHAQIRMGVPLRKINTDVPTKERFMKYVEVDTETGCWNWTGRIDTRGYATFRYAGKQPKAHRFGWIRVNGDVPKGHYIDHRCHNRRCVNIDHLRVVTPKKNSENRKGATIRSTTGIRGVSPRDNGTRFVGRVGHHGKVYSAGTFSTKEEAEKAVIALREKLYGTD